MTNPPQSTTTTTYDKKGHCIHHPQIKLRKKSKFKRQWIIIHDVCPSCVTEANNVAKNNDNDNGLSH